LYPVVEDCRRKGAAVLFSSHQLGDVERLADWIAVLAGGRLVAMLSQRELGAILADRGVMRVRLGAGRDGLLERVREHCPGAALEGDELIVPGAAASPPAAKSSG
jgi:Cu-processing system ATP-binding protein